MAKDERCGNCRYFEWFSDDRGECNAKLPPKAAWAIEEYSSSGCVVHESDGCALWKPKEPANG